MSAIKSLIQFTLSEIYGKGDDDFMISGIKQLNSFRCVLEIKLIEYIIKNQEKIETDMRVSLRRSADNKKQKEIKVGNHEKNAKNYPVLYTKNV
jgi:hypothetical protein